MYSLDQLDQPKACETPFEFEVKNETDEGTGLFLSVIGGVAPVITEFVEKHMQGRRVQQALAEKADPRGKRIHVVPFTEDVEFTTQLIAMRIVGWRGIIQDPCTPENTLKLCKNNPWSVRDQILLNSDKMENFPIGGPRN